MPKLKRNKLKLTNGGLITLTTGYTDKVYGTWDALIQVIAKRNIGDIVSNDEARAEMLKIMNIKILYSFNTFYSYTYLLAKCNIIIKLGRTKQFNNKCGGFEIIRQVEKHIRHKDIKKLQAQPSWLIWFADPTEIITRKSIRQMLKQLEE